VTHHDKLEAAKHYVRKIRNAEKQRYARAVFSHLAFNGPAPLDQQFDCSYMAKQAVRHHLYGVLL